MKNSKIVYKNFIKKKKFRSFKNLNKNYSNILKNIILNLDTNKDVLHPLSKKFKLNFKTEDLKKFKKYKNISIIGMGGSILGAEAIHLFLRKKIKKNITFFNNIDEEKIYTFKNKINIKKTLFIIISKSGGTIETISNILALKILKKNSKNIIVITEKNNKSIYLLSKKMNLFHIEHKNYIGGRYSVLSEVGMLPAYLMGVNIKNLRKKIHTHLDIKNKNFLKDSAIKLAHLFITKKLKTLVFFNYVPELNEFLYWCQQLIAESLGKEGKGFMPIISPAPKDHHSLLQLYLDGPKDKIFYIFSLDQAIKKKLSSKYLDNKFKFLNKKSLNQIKKAQKNAFIKVLKKKDIPFREFKIKDLSEEILGELFSYFILETAIIGKLANINPYDQPAVEQVKYFTKKILS